MDDKTKSEDLSHENEVKHGGKRPGAGRPLGSKSKSTLEIYGTYGI